MLSHLWREIKQRRDVMSGGDGGAVAILNRKILEDLTVEQRLDNK